MHLSLTKKQCQCCTKNTTSLYFYRKLIKLSHLHERDEKVCLNCNAAIYGRFCHVCGQENLNPKESFWHLTYHFVADIFHYDGKFFRTLKYLLFKPGYLAKEHLRGKRADYLHPIRLYVFVSAFFFLILFGFYTKHNTEKHSAEKTYTELIKEFEDFKKEKQDDILEKKKNTTAAFGSTIKKDSTDIADTDSAINLLRKDTTQKEIAELIFQVGTANWRDAYWEKNRTRENYLDSQRKLPSIKRDDFFEKKWELLNIAVAQRAKIEKVPRNEVWTDVALHNVPKGLFFGVPFYAFILFIIYARNKSFTYVSHVIFTIHLFCFSFILILLSMWFGSILNKVHLNITGILVIAATLVAMIYTYKGLRKFYNQTRGKTIAKFLILSMACILLTIFVFGVTLSISALTI